MTDSKNLSGQDRVPDPNDANDINNSFSSDDFDNEFNFNQSHRFMDELEPFSIRSPGGRSMSPIDRHYQLDVNLVIQNHDPDEIPLDLSISPILSADEEDYFISLEELNARIFSPELESVHQQQQKSLETIFEGVLLETPPRQENRSRNLLRHLALMRMADNPLDMSSTTLDSGLSQSFESNLSLDIEDRND